MNFSVPVLSYFFNFNLVGNCPKVISEVSDEVNKITNQSSIVVKDYKALTCNFWQGDLSLKHTLESNYISKAYNVINPLGHMVILRLEIAHSSVNLAKTKTLTVPLEIKLSKCLSKLDLLNASLDSEIMESIRSASTKVPKGKVAYQRTHNVGGTKRSIGDVGVSINALMFLAWYVPEINGHSFNGLLAIYFTNLSKRMGVGAGSSPFLIYLSVCGQVEERSQGLKAHISSQA